MVETRSPNLWDFGRDQETSRVSGGVGLYEARSNESRLPILEKNMLLIQHTVTYTRQDPASQTFLPDICILSSLPCTRHVFGKIILWPCPLACHGLIL